MTGDCDGVPQPICDAYRAGYQLGWDDGFVAGQREGAAVALQPPDTVVVWRREPPPADIVVMWSGLFMVLGLVVARFIWQLGKD